MRAAMAGIVVILMAACGGTPPGVPDPVGSPTGGFGGPAATADVVDTVIQEALVAAGVAPADATFLALTRFEGFRLEPRKVRIVEHLASGDTAAFIVTVDPASRGEPGLLGASSTTEGDTIRVSLVYFVASAGMPDDVRASLDGSAAGRPGLVSGPAFAAATFVPPVLTADVDGFQVIVEWAIAKAGDELRDQTLETVLERLVHGQAGSVLSIFKAGFAAQEGLSLGDDLDRLLVELEALERCAKDPTNPLTQQLYRDDPGAKDRVLEEIESTRRELIANTLVMQLGVLNEFAADFGPKWLSWAISPGTAWSKATLQDLNRQRLDQLARAIPKCDCPFTSSGGGGSSGGGSSGGSSGGGTGSSGGACRFPLTWTGTTDYTVTSDGVSIFEAHATGVKWQYDSAASDPSVSVYRLIGGTISWSYEWVMDRPGCGTETWRGDGKESLVPDEDPMTSVEGGPLDITEAASLSIGWFDPLRPQPWYSGEGHVRLHAPITMTDCLGGTELLQTDFAPPSYLDHWFETPVDPFPEVDGTYLRGGMTRTLGDIGRAWRWELIAGG